MFLFVRVLVTEGGGLLYYKRQFARRGMLRNPMLVWSPWCGGRVSLVLLLAVYYQPCLAERPVQRHSSVAVWFRWWSSLFAAAAPAATFCCLPRQTISCSYYRLLLLRAGGSFVLRRVLVVLLVCSQQTRITNHIRNYKLLLLAINTTSPCPTA